MWIRLAHTFMRRWRELAVVVALFVTSQLLYAYLGVRFDGGTFPGYMQFIDRPLLADRLIESLWYYHANPPLLNLIVGIALKLFGENATAFLNVGFHALGLLLAVSVYLLAAWFSGSRVAGYVACALLVFSPGFVLYENWLMYSFPAAALLTAAAVMLYRYVQTARTGWAVAFFATLAILLLTRSLFHLGWLVMIVALITVVLRDRRRQVLLAAALPVLVVTLWYGKNAYLFGSFSASSWGGLGLSNISTLVVTREELQPLVERGELSEYALLSRYEQIDRLFSAPVQSTGIPVLDQVRKSTGEYNFNNQSVLVTSSYYMSDGLKVIRRFPASYVIGLIISNRLFFSPTSMNLYFAPANRMAVRPMERIFNPLLYGVPARPGVVQQPHFGFDGKSFLEVNTSIPLFVIWWVLLGYGYMQARTGLLSDDATLKPRAITFGFIVFTMLYVYTIGNALELAENYRYRWLVEPLFFVLGASAVTHLLRRIFSSRSRKQVSPAAT